VRRAPSTVSGVVVGPAIRIEVLRSVSLKKGDVVVVRGDLLYKGDSKKHFALLSVYVANTKGTK